MSRNIHSNHIEPKVAIIIPVYNTEEFLAECLDSVLAQTYSNLLLFVVDDCSTDRSLEIIQSYAQLDKRIIILQCKENGGVSVARNKALQLIEKDDSIKFVSFCDSDDTISPIMIEELVKYIQQEKADVATCCVKKTHTLEKSSSPFANYCSYSPEGLIEQVLSLGKWSHTIGNGGFSCTRLFRTEVIKGVRFCTDKNVCEDELYCIEVATRIKKATYIPQALYYYRQRPNSLSKGKKFSEMLLLSRLASLPLARQISHYAEILTACAIINKLKNNKKIIGKARLQKLSPLIQEARKMKLISTKAFIRFTIAKLI